jgi:hypothetical protein
MPYKQTIISVLPNSEKIHFLDREFSVAVSDFIRTLRRAYESKILSTSVSRSALVSKVEIIWNSKETLDEYNQQLHEAFPNLSTWRDEYHSLHGINFSVGYEEVE